MLSCLFFNCCWKSSSGASFPRRLLPKKKIRFLHSFAVDFSLNVETETIFFISHRPMKIGERGKTTHYGGINPSQICLIERRIVEYMCEWEAIFTSISGCFNLDSNLTSQQVDLMYIFWEFSNAQAINKWLNPLWNNMFFRTISIITELFQQSRNSKKNENSISHLQLVREHGDFTSPSDEGISFVARERRWWWANKDKLSKKARAE